MTSTWCYYKQLWQAVQMLWSFYSLLEQIPTVPQRMKTFLSSLHAGKSPATSIANLLLNAHANVNSQNEQG